MPYNHLQGKGCLYCSNNQKYSIDEFIKRANIKHNNKFIYNNINYVNNLTKIEIECKIHGVFLQYPGSHLMDIGCSDCSGNRKSNEKEFIKKANLKHNNLYDYKDVIYKNNSTKVNIFCRIHGDFMQTPRDHLSGRGCSICKNSKGEIEIKKILDKKCIRYEKQFIFDDLKYINHLKFDFAIFNKDKLYCLIEYNGEQHYKFKKLFHRDLKGFSIMKKRDNLKKRYCKINYIPLFIIKYDENIEEKINSILNNL